MGHPSYPPRQQPGYPPQQPGPPAATNSPTAGYSWLMGLIVVFLIPGLSSIAAGVAMALYSRSEVKKARTETDRRNANRAGNWGLTYAIGTVVLLGAHVAGLFVFDGQPILDGFWPYGSIILTWIVWSFVHVAVSIIGTVATRKGRLMPITGIPFFR